MKGKGLLRSWRELRFIKAVGKPCLMHVRLGSRSEGAFIEVPVLPMDFRNCFGNIEALICPMHGKGTMWVHASRLLLNEGPSAERWPVSTKELKQMANEVKAMVGELSSVGEGMEKCEGDEESPSNPN